MMFPRFWRFVCALAFLSAVLLTPACGIGINRSVTIDDGTAAGGQSTVNGSIRVGSDVVISGSLETVNGKIRVADNVELRKARTVNGSIRIGDDVTAEGVSTVNGSLKIGERGSIAGDVSAVNGSIGLASGSSVERDVSNVNGEIEVFGTEIGGDLSTVSGDVLLTDRSTLRGDLTVRKRKGLRWGKSERKPVVVIGPGSKVLGSIVAEQEIELFISESAEVSDVRGKISLSEAVRFSGDRP